jgi:hypothetical protein
MAMVSGGREHIDGSNVIAVKRGYDGRGDAAL